jgi:hypothetical protein
MEGVRENIEHFRARYANIFVHEIGVTGGALRIIAVVRAKTVKFDGVADGIGDFPEETERVEILFANPLPGYIIVDDVVVMSGHRMLDGFHDQNSAQLKTIR